MPWKTASRTARIWAASLLLGTAAAAAGQESAPAAKTSAVAGAVAPTPAVAESAVAPAPAPARVGAAEAAVLERRVLEPEGDDLQARLARPLTLDDCLQIALKRNIPLAIARQSRDAVRTGIGAAYGAFLPVVTMSGTRLSEETRSAIVPPDSLTQATESIDLKTQSSASARLSQKLPFGTTLAATYHFSKTGTDRLEAGGATLAITQPLLRNAGWRVGTAGVRDAHLSSDAEEVALRSQVLQVMFDVKSSYFEVLRRRKLIEVNKQAVGRDQALVEFSRAKVEAKLATTRDVLSAEIVLAQDQGRLVTAEAQHQAALDALGNVLGLRIAREIQIEDVDVSMPPVPVDEGVWIDKALRDNPDVRRARLDLQRDALSKRLAGNARLPQLDLQVSYDELRDRLGAQDSGARPRVRTWQGSVNMSYPLFNKPLGNAYRRATLQYEQSRKLQVETERQVTLSVRDAVRNLQRSQDRISILEKNIEGARAKVEFARVNFQLGRASNLDITDAQKDLLTAETDHVNELVNYRVELARLEQLLGGSL